MTKLKISIAEAHAKAQSDKLKSETNAKIAELKKQYDDKKASYIALSKEKKTYELALKDLDSVSPDLASALPEQQQKAKELASQIRSMSERVSKQGAEVAKAKKALNQSDCVLTGSRSKSDRIGWYYSSYPGQRYRMSEYGSRDKKKAVKYIYSKGDGGIWGEVTSEAMYLNDDYSSDNYVEKIAKLGEKVK